MLAVPDTDDLEDLLEGASLGDSQINQTFFILSMVQTRGFPHEKASAQLHAILGPTLPSLAFRIGTYVRLHRAGDTLAHLVRSAPASARALLDDDPKALAGALAQRAALAALRTPVGAFALGLGVRMAYDTADKSVPAPRDAGYVSTLVGRNVVRGGAAGLGGWFGAGIGSVVVPGVGSLLGGMVGSVIGDYMVGQGTSFV
jgi:hypothetical protein